MDNSGKLDCAVSVIILLTVLLVFMFLFASFDDGSQPACTSYTGATPTSSYVTYLPLVTNNWPLNLLQNPSFEKPWQPANGHRCLTIPASSQPYFRDVDNIFVPPDWIFWFRHEPGTWDQPEGSPLQESLRVYNGNWAYGYFAFFRKMDGGFYQQIQVSVGTCLRLAAHAHAWSNSHDGLHPDDPYWSEGAGYSAGFKLEGETTGDDWRNFTFYVGIDPTGGLNPYASTVIWSRGAHIYNAYAQVPIVETTAQSTTVTVFIRAVTLLPFKHNNCYWDNITLVEVKE